MRVAGQALTQSLQIVFEATVDMARNALGRQPVEHALLLVEDTCRRRARPVGVEIYLLAHYRKLAAGALEHLFVFG